MEIKTFVVWVSGIVFLLCFMFLPDAVKAGFISTVLLLIVMSVILLICIASISESVVNAVEDMFEEFKDG